MLELPIVSWPLVPPASIFLLGPKSSLSALIDWISAESSKRTGGDEKVSCNNASLNFSVSSGICAYCILHDDTRIYSFDDASGIWLPLPTLSASS